MKQRFAKEWSSRRWGIWDALDRAANNHLGAYSQLLNANNADKLAIMELFRGIGEYRSYLLTSGKVAGCSDCAQFHGNFSTWFFKVAWDWVLFVTWPRP